jgi:hypothetical protein
VLRAALALVKSGVLADPPDLRARLARVDPAPFDAVWLWALAHEVLADERFLHRALSAARPETTLEHGLALLRLHQLTGELRWIDDAQRLLLTAPPSTRASRRDTALLAAELMMPEQVRPLPAGWPPPGQPD